MGLSPVSLEVVPGARRIAVLVANGIGDYMFTLPALDALRAAYPEARITLLGLAWHSGFLAGRPGPVDEVRALPSTPEAGASPAADQFWATEAQRGYDIAIQLHGGGRHSNPLIASLGAGLTIGPRSPEAPPLDRWIAYRVRQHEVARWLEVVALAGATAPVGPPALAVTEADRRASETVVDSSRAPQRPLVTVCPGAGDVRRRWPAARFGLVAAALAGAGARVVVSGDAGDRATAAQVVAASGGSASDVSGSLDLGGLAGLLARSAVVVGNDTGPLHLAAAVGAATVGVYWGVNAVHAGPLRVDRHATAIAWDPRCPVCSQDLADLTRPRCSHDASLVETVRLAEVRDLALELFSRAPNPAP